MHKMSMGSFGLTPPNVTMTPTGKKRILPKITTLLLRIDKDEDNHYTFSVSFENKRKIES